MSCSFLVSVILILPEFLAFKITPFGDLYEISLTTMSSHILYGIYYITIALFENLIILISLVYFSILICFSLNKLSKSKINLNYRKKKLYLKKQMTITKMILILNILFIISHLSIIIAIIMTRIDEFSKTQYNYKTNIFRNISFAVIMIIISTNPLIFMKFKRDINLINKVSTN